MAKRAFVIAAAGNHGLLMVGPPGAGKSMMAKRMPTILSPLSEEERVETMLIHSVAGQDLVSVKNAERPFRAPHHSISKGGLVGGGRPVRPGEVSLAHHGVLFLDELPEFGPSVLQALRQPIEEHEVRLVRVDGTYVFPCDFLLVAAANPCPCGFLGDPDHQCMCSAARIEAYQARIGGPLMDRIDVLVDVGRPSSSRIISGERGISSHDMAEQVKEARDYASWRRARDDGKPDEGRSVPELHLDGSAGATLDAMAKRLGLGGRNIVRIARVARTIADLDGSEEVQRDHVMEACAFRTRATL
jgi:magnesium chelatase family protein